jgi:cell division protein FtsB
MDKGKGGARRYLLWVGFFFLLLFLLSLFSSRGILSLYRLYRTEQRLHLQIAESKAKNAALKEEAASWQEDLGRIEKVARDELGLVKPGETVYQF